MASVTSIDKLHNQSHIELLKMGKYMQQTKPVDQAKQPQKCPNLKAMCASF
jgi:hypothetical protein